MKAMILKRISGFDKESRLLRLVEQSVANVTSNDVKEFLELAVRAQIKPDYKEYPLEKANEALLEIKEGNIQRAKVFKVSEKS